jgi:hypothetical protein
VDRRKRGLKGSVAVDGRSIPLGSVTAPANRHDSPPLVPTLEAAWALGIAPEGAIVHLDRGYDSKLTRLRLLKRGLVAEVSEKGLAPRTHPPVLHQQQYDQGDLAHRGRVAEQGPLPYRHPGQDRQRRVSDQRP